MPKLNKAAIFTDIHFGRKNNSIIHNEDCKNFITWFVDKSISNSVDHVIFMGDWFEERDSVNTLTFKYAMDCAQALNDMGPPIYFIVGNHDLYYRDNREVYASYAYKNLSNFIIVDSPMVTDDMVNRTLLSPYLFSHEYAGLMGYLDIPIWFGHFEFNGFVITGDTIRMQHGPNPDNYSTPKRIFSGHFHKRQQSKNIVYIGNAFPMDFGDANDVARGMAIYTHDTDTVEFLDWDNCPSYIYTNLSQLIDGGEKLPPNSRVKCVVDKEITYNDSSTIKNDMIDKFNLREFNLEEIVTPMPPSNLQLTDDQIKNESTISLVRTLLKTIDSEKIDNEKLINIYDGLK